jgi:hypothetical protein
MSRQRLLCPLWHESLAEPRTSWISGRPGHGQLVYGSAGLPAGGGLFGKDLRNLWLTCAAAAPSPGFALPDLVDRTSELPHHSCRALNYCVDFDSEKWA